MKLSDFDSIVDLAGELNQIDQHLADADTRLGVTLGGKYHDELCNMVRPVLISHFYKQRSAVLLKMQKLGVDVVH